jgi:hypothetical protein
MLTNLPELGGSYGKVTLVYQPEIWILELLGLLLYFAEGGDTFLRNVIGFIRNCTALQPRRSYSSYQKVTGSCIEPTLTANQIKESCEDLYPVNIQKLVTMLSLDLPECDELLY